MESINIHQAKTHLSRLLERVAAGETIVIARAGKPVARLVPYTSETKPREPGYWRGRVRIHDDFDTPPDEMAGAFRGEGD
jgi:prevent-host-death family protein